MLNIRAIILTSLLFYVHASYLGFLQQEQESKITCKNLNGTWLGLNYFYNPKKQQYCLYTTISEAYTTDIFYDTLVTSKILLDTTKDQTCKELSPIFTAKCLYGNGFILEDGSSQGYEGQTQDGNIILAKSVIQNDYYGWALASQNIQSDKFNKRLTQVVTDMNNEGLGSATCLDLNGLWFGKVLVFYNSFYKDENCLYDVTVNIEATLRKIQLNIKSKSSHSAGDQKTYKCEDLEQLLILDCDQNQQILFGSQLRAGSFNQDFISIYKSDSIKRYDQQIILFRDQ